MQPISCFWYRDGLKNLGDVWNRDLIHKLSGREPQLLKTAVVPRYVCCGSILNQARSGDTVWGAGAMRDEPIATGLNYCAVRGPLTAAIANTSCAIGDPGVLMPYIYGVHPNPKYELGIICHYIDIDRLPELRLAYPNAQYIDIIGKPKATLTRIATCKRILSSTLHGIIAAEALGIPTQWMQLSDKVLGNGFKFRDYYLSTNRVAAPLDFKQRIGPVAEWVKPPSLKSLQHDLISSCPFITPNILYEFNKWSRRWHTT